MSRSGQQEKLWSLHTATKAASAATEYRLHFTVVCGDALSIRCRRPLATVKLRGATSCKGTCEGCWGGWGAWREKSVQSTWQLYDAGSPSGRLRKSWAARVRFPIPGLPVRPSPGTAMMVPHRVSLPEARSLSGKVMHWQTLVDHSCNKTEYGSSLPQRLSNLARPSLTKRGAHCAMTD